MSKPTYRAPPSYSEVPTTDPDHPLAELSAQDPNDDHHSPLLGSSSPPPPPPPPPTTTTTLEAVAVVLDAQGQPFDPSFDPTPANDREAALVRYHVARREQEQLREPPKKPAEIPFKEQPLGVQVIIVLFMGVAIFAAITLSFGALFLLISWIGKLARWIL